MHDSRKIILCVDDEKLVLISLKAQLKKNLQDEYFIETAESGEDGLTIVEEIIRDDYELSLIITDQIMPGIKGDEFLIKVFQLLPSTRSIMLTGQANADAVGKALNQAKLFRYISKPWDETDLMMAVTAALDSYYKQKTIDTQKYELEKLVQQLKMYNDSLELIVSDRTAQVKKQNEELLEKENMLQELNISKDKLFAVIGHDMKNSLAALLSVSSSLEEAYPDMEETDRKEGVHRIKHACIEMNQLMENLLEWAKVQTGRVRIAPVEFDLYSMAEEMISIIKTATEKKQLTIKQSLDCRALVKADRNMVGTVLRNLLNNAIKFSPRGSEIQIICNAGIRENDTEFHQVIIEDHGNGMEPQQIARLFHFDRTETSRGTENEKGTGLGLIICKDFLELNGGTISVESEKGKGSRFIFTLPSFNRD